NAVEQLENLADSEAEHNHSNIQKAHTKAKPQIDLSIFGLSQGAQDAINNPPQITPLKLLDCLQRKPQIVSWSKDGAKNQGHLLDMKGKPVQTFTSPNSENMETS